jgi:hypothetical protein
MQPISKISHQWRDKHAAEAYTTGVSLHSHTSHSVETLDFVQAMCANFPFANRLLNFYDQKSQREGNRPLDFTTAHWRPPLVPRMAFDLEFNQIAKLGLEPLISITDHDDIQAPLLLRTIPSARRIPVSVEWTVPFGETAFHMGIHNLPSAEALHWMEVFADFTARPSESALRSLLAELNASPHILIVLNHPAWDLYTIGEANHFRELNRFLAQNNGLIHALELNGLRHSRENAKVERLATRWRQLLISGGDRHGMEPNANLNLTDATSFNEFVDEIRVERRSHVLYMEQYARPWEQRILDSTLDAIVDHPEFSPGWQKWDERAFHADNDGVMRPMAELWQNGRPPLPLHLAILAARLLKSRQLGAVAAAAIAWLGGGAQQESSSREVAQDA